MGILSLIIKLTAPSNQNQNNNPCQTENGELQNDVWLNYEVKTKKQYSLTIRLGAKISHFETK